MDMKSGGSRSHVVSAQLFLFVILLLTFVSANATSSIARRVANSCAPAATMPDVGSCTACHTSGSPSLNDLNAAGMQSQAGNDAFFCPATAPTPTPTPTPPPAGMGMSGSGTGMSGMGMGTGGSMPMDDDEDEDEDEDEEDHRLEGDDD